MAAEINKQDGPLLRMATADRTSQFRRLSTSARRYSAIIAPERATPQHRSRGNHLRTERQRSVAAMLSFFSRKKLSSAEQRYRTYTTETLGRVFAGRVTFTSIGA